MARNFGYNFPTPPINSLTLFPTPPINSLTLFPTPPTNRLSELYKKPESKYIDIDESKKQYLKIYKYGFIPPITPTKTQISILLHILRTNTNYSDSKTYELMKNTLRELGQISGVPLIYHKIGGSSRHKYTRNTRRRHQTRRVRKHK